MSDENIRLTQKLMKDTISQRHFVVNILNFYKLSHIRGRKKILQFLNGFA
jgi:hypothetical protein